jgi:hypothetical protein
MDVERKGTSCDSPSNQNGRKGTPSIESLLVEAVEYLADLFENDEPVDGASMVDWFAEWRQRAVLELLNRR